MAHGIQLTQPKPVKETNPFAWSQTVISPVMAGGFYQEISQTGLISEFLFRMEKDGAVYWIGATVPAGTTDLSKAHVYFHPTVRQQEQVYAKENDYPDFRGGWDDTMRRYVRMQGAQLAGVRQTVMIVPFMTMAALKGAAPAYMFATRPVETLNAILTAVRDAAAPGQTGQVTASKIAVASFSSGIGAMLLFIGRFGNTRLIVETTDFDGPLNKQHPQIVTRSPGAVGRVFCQNWPHIRDRGWYTMPKNRFAKISKFHDKGVHAQIGWMTYYLASMWSIV